MLLTLGRSAPPTPPAEIADEVENYAREHGRTAKLWFAPSLFIRGRIADGFWVVSFSLKPNDKRMLAYQQGMAPKPPTEDVWLQEPNPLAGQPMRGVPGQRELTYRPLDILQMGASGVRNFLERGNLWSGRGEFRSLEAAVRRARDLNDEDAAKAKAESNQMARDLAGDKRRQALGIPLVSVGIDLADKHPNGAA